MTQPDHRRRLTATATAVAVGVLTLLTAPAHAAGTHTDSTWGDTGATASPDVHATPFDYDSPTARGALIRKWPRGKITYFDATKDKQAVAAAVKIWNSSGLKVNFRKIANRKRADIVIRNSRRVPSGCGSGLATVGYQPHRNQGFVNILHGTDLDGQSCSTPGQTLVVAHELGHILGLRHDDSRCSLMNSSHTLGVAPTKCLRPGNADEWEPDEMPGRWRCRVTEVTDLKKVKKLYGGRPRPVRANPWCDLYTRIPAAGALTGSPTVAFGVDWLTYVQRPAEPAMPAYLFRNAKYGYYELHLTQGTCATAPATVHNDATLGVRSTWATVGPNDDILVPPGGVYEQNVPAAALTAPGPWCFTYFAFDELARQALAPSYLDVTVVAPAVAARRD